MHDPRFRLVCPPSALTGSPADWAREMLREGDVALISQEGIDAIDAASGALERPVIAVVRSGGEEDGAVVAYADSLPLIWIAPRFSARVRDWAERRGPMTLLVEASAGLPDDERRRIDRFVAILGRQSE